MRFYDAYDGGRQQHVTGLQAVLAVGDLGYERGHVDREIRELRDGARGIISDAVAQTIAAWWHSPARPLTTRLSTMGRVDMALTLDDFATEAARPQYDVPGQAALRALGAYIEHKQACAPAGYRPCACDGCFDLVVSTPGGLCAECGEAGCDNQGSECERADAYGVEPCGSCSSSVGCDGGCGVEDDFGRGHAAGDHSACMTRRGYCD